MIGKSEVKPKEFSGFNLIFHKVFTQIHPDIFKTKIELKVDKEMELAYRCYLLGEIIGESYSEEREEPEYEKLERKHAGN